MADRRAAPKPEAAGTPALRVPCPACGAPTLYIAANRWRPFCSERCRLGDLGAWATERYRVRAHDEPDPDEAESGH